MTREAIDTLNREYVAPNIDKVDVAKADTVNAVRIFFAALKFLFALQTSMNSHLDILGSLFNWRSGCKFYLDCNADAYSSRSGYSR